MISIYKCRFKGVVGKEGWEGGGGGGNLYNCMRSKAVRTSVEPF